MKVNLNNYNKYYARGYKDGKRASNVDYEALKERYTQALREGIAMELKLSKLEATEKKLLTLFERITTRAVHTNNTSGINRMPSIERLAKRGIELIDPENRLINE